MNGCKSCALHNAVYTGRSTQPCFRCLREVYFQHYLNFKNSCGDAIPRCFSHCTSCPPSPPTCEAVSYRLLGPLTGVQTAESSPSNAAEI